MEYTLWRLDYGTDYRDVDDRWRISGCLYRLRTYGMDTNTRTDVDAVVYADPVGRDTLSDIDAVRGDWVCAL